MVAPNWIRHLWFPELIQLSQDQPWKLPLRLDLLRKGLFYTVPDNPSSDCLEIEWQALSKKGYTDKEIDTSI